jgi:hypothetical protein
MPNPQAPPAPVPADLPSAKQQLRRRQAGQAELAQADRRAAQQLQQRFRRAPQTPQEGKMRTRTPKGVRHAPAPPRTSPKPVGPTASGETPSLSQTRPAASICRIDGSDRRALPRLTGESRGPGTPWTSPSAADNVVQRRRYRRPVFPTGATPPTTPCSRRTTPRKRPLPQRQVVEGMHSSRTFSRHGRQVEPRPQIHIHAPTATTAPPHQACLPPAAPPALTTTDPQGDRPCPGGTHPRRPRRRRVKRTRTGKRVHLWPRIQDQPPPRTHGSETSNTPAGRRKVQCATRDVVSKNFLSVVRPPTDRRTPLRCVVTDPRTPTPRTLPGVCHSTPGTHPPDRHLPCPQ